MLKKSSALLFFLPLIPLLQTLDIFITNRLNPTGNGSRISPYNNFITALWKTSQNLSSLSNETELNFLFVTNYILILGSDVNSSNLTNINGISQLFPEISQFKLIRIMPYICYQELLAFVSPPETCNYRTYVNIKTDSFTFLVNTDFYLQNLIFSGNDLNIVYDSNTDSICYFSLEGCCSEELLVVNPYSTKCTLSDLRISRSPTRTFFKSSLFTVTNYKNNTSFKIIHCKFENINGITKSGGFSNLFLSNNVGLSNFTFIVNSTVFRKNYLKDGIIEFSNSPNKFIMMNSSNLMYNYYNLNDKTKGQAFYLLNASLVNMTDCLFVDSYAGIKLSYSVCFMNNVTFNGKNHYSVITNDPDVIILEIETNSNFTGNNLIIKNWNLEFEVTRSLISSFTANNLVINNLQILENNIQNHRIFYLYGSINSISINNLYFFNNTGPGFSVTGGFFIYAYKSTFVTITNSFFSIIIGSGNGGIFYVWDGTFLLSNVTITNLSLNGPSTSLGAVIYSPLNLNFTSHNCVFKNIKGNFGIFRFHEADAIFKDANFLRIETKEFGIIYLNRQITCLIENSTFKDMILG